jgi:hypothetical protein
MAYSKATFNDILLSLSYRYGEASVPAAGIDNRKYWVNRGIEFIVDKLQLNKSVSVTVASGVCNLSVTPSSDPAPDFKSFDKLLDSTGLEVPMVSKSDYTLMGGQVCCITGDHATGYVLNVKTDGTYTLYYQYYISPLVSTTDICPISDPEAVAAYAYAQIRLSETDPLEDANTNMQECLNRIDAMAEDISRSEGPLTFKTLY